MKRIPCLLVMLIIFAGPAFASGAAEESKPPEVLDGEWTLCITAFDVSGLPAVRQVVGDMLARHLAQSLKTIQRRQRPPEELAYYQERAQAQAASAAAGKLAAKRDERDRLIYRGDPDWRYRASLEKLDQEIAALEASWRNALVQVPLVAERPVFKITQANLAGTFPQAPQAGEERQFCLKEKADAVLSGSIIEYHERFYVSLGIYALYSDVPLYEDSSIFSSDDISAGMEELAGRLAAFISGADPAALTVRAEPGDAVITIDGVYAGQGAVPLTERSPGTVGITVFAEGYEAQSLSLDLAAGELAEVDIELGSPASYPVTLESGGEPASVYQGSRYMGETPLSLDLPLGGGEYFRLESPPGAVARAVILPGPGLSSGPGPGSGPEPLVFSLDLAPPQEAGMIEGFRQGYYGAWGRFWIALPLALIFHGLTDTMIQSYNASSARKPEYYTRTTVFAWVDAGLWVVTAAFGVESIVRAVFYFIAASDNAPGIVP
ncbi:MAG: PEGA domain-containing protein [Treponema sp.]|nr:PEGA domain-containing protein [Treponema sp.]